MEGHDLIGLLLVVLFLSALGGGDTRIARR
jgi:hypothetical protein